MTPITPTRQKHVFASKNGAQQHPRASLTYIPPPVANKALNFVPKLIYSYLNTLLYACISATCAGIWCVQTRYARIANHYKECRMYRRVNSGRFIGLTTFLIVVVMAIFTWVMYGMAKQVFVLSDVMLEMNDSIKSMNRAVTGMSDSVDSMNTTIADMATDIHAMGGSVASMSGDISIMAQAMPEMNTTMLAMSQSVGKMSYDLGTAAYAFRQPMSYMWGNVMPF
jgi:uncharacterized protein YoxC